jgi:hypothetical protein
MAVYFLHMTKNHADKQSGGVLTPCGGRNRTTTDHLTSPFAMDSETVNFLSLILYYIAHRNEGAHAFIDECQRMAKGPQR